MLKPDLPYFDDPEGLCVPPGCDGVIDAHVHVFPPNIFSAIWKWFDTHAWKIRYRLTTQKIFDFLLKKGASHIVALQYAHKPGIAGQLNQYLAGEIIPFKGRVSGMATVFPGEPGAAKILINGFDLGLNGVKLHAHVQCFDMNAPYMDEIYQVCYDEKKPLIMHVGTEPKSQAYACDPYVLCSIKKLVPVLKNYPGLKICVPHLGFGEISGYQKLIETYDNLWTDTTMVICDYFPMDIPADLTRYRTDRVMYGSDFPNIPYEWDRELKVLANACISEQRRRRILFKNASEFFNLKQWP